MHDQEDDRISHNEETAVANLARLHYPGIILSGKDAVSGSGGEGRLYIQGRKDKQELSHLEMACHPEFPHPKLGWADCAVLSITQK